MKTKFKIITAIFILFLTGCSLEEQIYDMPTSDAFIKSNSDVVPLLNGVYSHMQYFNSFKSNLLYTIMFGGDEIASTNALIRSFAERTVSSTSPYFTTPWNSFYSTINEANTLMNTLNNLDEGVVSESYKQRIIGELHFLRAFSYFYLVRIHGGVPIHTEPIGGDSDFYPSRNTVDEVYELIFEDFKTASELCLPSSELPQNEFGHATKGASQAMLSLAYLTYANNQDLSGKSDLARNYYQLAENYADSVILSNEYSLIPDYGDLWDVTKERSAYQEVIFGIQQTRDATTASSPSKGSKLASYMQPNTRWNISGNANNGQGASIVMIQPWFYDLYSTGEYTNDYRTEVSFLTRWKYRDQNRDKMTYPEIKLVANDLVELYPFLDKYKDPDGYDVNNNENDFFIIRLAAVYLIKAEAENELNGPTGQAYAAFNMVRERARNAKGNVRTTPEDLPLGLSKDEFRIKIFDERGLELVGEGHRWFDSVRMRYSGDKTMVQYRYEDFYPGMTKAAPSYNTSTNTWGGGRVQPTNVVPWSRKFLLWPMPSTEIDTNPNVTQNSEYGW